MAARSRYRPIHWPLADGTAALVVWRHGADTARFAHTTRYAVLGVKGAETPLAGVVRGKVAPDRLRREPHTIRRMHIIRRIHIIRRMHTIRRMPL